MGTKNKEKKNSSIGCFILVFLLIAAGISAATKGEGPIGTLVIVIMGVVVAFAIARAVSGNDN